MIEASWVKAAADALTSDYGVQSAMALVIAGTLFDRYSMLRWEVDPLEAVQRHMDTDEKIVDPDDFPDRDEATF